MKPKYSVVVIGGGTGGIMFGSQFLKKSKGHSVAIIEPAEYHYYQPAWTLVGAGTYSMEKTKKPMADVMPKNAHWIKKKAIKIEANENCVITDDNSKLYYDYLIVAPGLVMDYSKIEGLKDALDKGVACSNYTDPEKTFELLKSFKGGTAIFTQPSTPIKCGGAPQKAAYLSADYFWKNDLASKTNIVFATPGSVIFGIKPIRETLEKVLNRYQIDFKPFYDPIKIDSDNKTVTFKLNHPEDKKFVLNEANAIKEKYVGPNEVEIPFDFLHLSPPQKAPDFIKESNLANEGGWLEVDKHSLQHKNYPNIFGIGDAAALPTAKTGAAIRKQVPVVVDNVKKLIAENRIGDLSYNGYSSCPLVTAYGKMVLAEFDYEGNFTPDPELKKMLIFNSAKEHWRLWVLKKYILPWLYWKKMLKGQEV